MPKCYKINIEFIANNGNLYKQGVTPNNNQNICKHKLKVIKINKC